MREISNHNYILEVITDNGYRFMTLIANYEHFLGVLDHDCRILRQIMDHK